MAENNLVPPFTVVFSILYGPQTSKHQLAKVFLLISTDVAKEKEKKEKCAGTSWCFKVCSPYSNNSFNLKK
jgi:hypothetical protein